MKNILIYLASIFHLELANSYKPGQLAESICIVYTSRSGTKQEAVHLHNAQNTYLCKARAVHWQVCMILHVSIKTIKYSRHIKLYY